MQPEERDILEEIVKKRRHDISELGYTLGHSIPEKRTRRIVPFLTTKGVILEIKRASPSRGSIAPGLKATATAVQYAACGASAISVLTEENYFKGSLDDLISVAAAVPNTAILRKDFLVDEQEIDIAFRCGADAVLLIARILDCDTLVSMVRRCADLGITAFIEIRLDSDIEKLQTAIQAVPKGIVAGVNSRDLRDFSIDPLMPAGMLPRLPKRVVYESGIRTPNAAASVASMGFSGMLLGEAAARSPEEAGSLVNAFMQTKQNERGEFWIRIAKKLAEHTSERNAYAPLVKICGITRAKDAVRAAMLGADMLGFIFVKSSKRLVDAKSVRTIVSEVRQKYSPLCIGVITDPESREAKEAFTLVKEGILDAIQFHGCTIPPMENFGNIPCYGAIQVGTAKDIETLNGMILSGQPRVLIDAKIGTMPGGTGCRIDSELVRQAATLTKLWLAGGINGANIAEIAHTFHPELLDISSGIESGPGIKDAAKMTTLFAALQKKHGNTTNHIYNRRKRS